MKIIVASKNMAEVGYMEFESIIEKGRKNLRNIDVDIIVTRPVIVVLLISLFFF